MNITATIKYTLEKASKETCDHFHQPKGTLELFDRGSVGIYPNLNRQGFHLDVRGFMSRWGKLAVKYVAYGVAKEYARCVAPDGNKPTQP